MDISFPQIYNLVQEVPSRAKGPCESSVNAMVKFLQNHEFRVLPLLSQTDSPRNSLAQLVVSPYFQALLSLLCGRELSKPHCFQQVVLIVLKRLFLLSLS